VLVLPNDDRILVQVSDVGAADALRVLLHNHPAKVRVQETLADGVGVLVGVGVAVVSTVVTAPPANRALDSTAANSSEEDRKRERGVVGLVRPKAMVTSGNTKTGPEIVDDSPKSSLPLQRCPEGSDTARNRDTNNEDDLLSCQRLLFLVRSI
jgi:hypothetical protein